MLDTPVSFKGGREIKHMKEVLKMNGFWLNH